MKTPYACALTALLISLPTLAGDKLPDLGGTYRVRGECYERTELDEYKRCVAWNQLVLKPDTVAGRYRYMLDTNTFATTQGGCSLEGTVSLQAQDGLLVLVAPVADHATCPIRFKVDRKALTLDMAKAQADAPECRNACSSNASLYTDPFPRSSRKK